MVLIFGTRWLELKIIEISFKFLEKTYLLEKKNPQSIVKVLSISLSLPGIFSLIITSIISGVIRARTTSKTSIVMEINIYATRFCIWVVTEEAPPSRSNAVESNHKNYYKDKSKNSSNNSTNLSKKI